MANMAGSESGGGVRPLEETEEPSDEDAREGKKRQPERRDFVMRQEWIRLVVSDSIRFLGWGRDWHELPEVICRLDGRPNETITRRILKANRDVIEKEAMGGV